MICMRAMSSLAAGRQIGRGGTARRQHVPSFPGVVPMKHRRMNIIRMAASSAETRIENVGQIMTRGGILTVSPEDTLDHALEILVEHHVTGLPVVDAQGQVVGVVSDFDLLALEGVTKEEKARGFFPEAGSDWKAFFELQKFVEKNKGKTVQDVMTSNPICVGPHSSIEDAANLLLRMKIRRLPVVDDQGYLVGILTRSNIIKAAWEARKIQES